jgi:hypothetical protein
MVDHPWYWDIFYYLQHERCPNHLENHVRRMIRLEDSKYLILRTLLFHRYVDGLLLCCTNEIVAQNMLEKLHGVVDSNIHIDNHFSVRTTGYKILRSSYYWPFIVKDSYKFVMNVKGLLGKKNSHPCLYILFYLSFHS